MPPEDSRQGVLEIPVNYASALTGAAPGPNLTRQLGQVAEALDTSSASSLTTAFPLADRLVDKDGDVSLNGEERADLQERGCARMRVLG
jgi:hypothetical protein